MCCGRALYLFVGGFELRSAGTIKAVAAVFAECWCDAASEIPATARVVQCVLETHNQPTSSVSVGLSLWEAFVNFNCWCEQSVEELTALGLEQETATRLYEYASTQPLEAVNRADRQVL